MTVSEVAKLLGDIAYVVDTKSIANINDEYRYKIVKQLYDIEDWLNELEWYRKQDLIKRSDALWLISQECDDCGYHKYNQIKNIPKAELSEE